MLFVATTKKPIRKRMGYDWGGQPTTRGWRLQLLSSHLPRAVGSAICHPASKWIQRSYDRQAGLLAFMAAALFQLSWNLGGSIIYSGGPAQEFHLTSLFSRRQSQSGHLAIFGWFQYTPAGRGCQPDQLHAEEWQGVLLRIGAGRRHILIPSIKRRISPHESARKEEPQAPGG